jgi:crotonobetainyl-CoA:carnitine CoA-transferase CaiB-like acyl-CoA transferase
MELQNDPDFEKRGIMQWIDHPSCGPFKMPAWPVRFGGAPPPIKPAPLLGQHNTPVLGDWLGLSAEKVEALHKDGVI